VFAYPKPRPPFFRFAGTCPDHVGEVPTGSESATHQSRPSLPAPSPFLPSLHSSLFFSEDCALFSATAVSQPFAYQSFPHSFHRDGRCTPSRCISDLVTQRSRSRSFISSTYKLQIFYLLSFDIHASDGGCMGYSQPPNLPTCEPSSLAGPISFRFTLFRTLLRPRKTQLLSFQAIPNSFAKTPGVWGRCYPRALRASRSGVGPTSFKPKTLLSFRPASPLCSASLRVLCVSALSFSPKTGQCHLRHMVRDIYCSCSRLRTV
jgi:hypothetical protein